MVDERSFGNGNAVELTIRSSALTGDAILIPAAGYDYNGTPFDEYIMIDRSLRRACMLTMPLNMVWIVPQKCPLQ